MDTILIIDYGSQYNQLISRRIREKNVFSIIVSPNEPLLLSPDIKGIILSGGPASVYDNHAPQWNELLYQTNLPILGICYGMQLMVQAYGGVVYPGVTREYGSTSITMTEKGRLNASMSATSRVWMSHSDQAITLPEGFVCLAKTPSSIAMIEHVNHQRYAVQFHPEVTQSDEGMNLIDTFLFSICQVKPTWTMAHFVKNKIQSIQQIVQSERVILGLSGGVDSTVCARLIQQAIGRQLTCLFIDTGLLRQNELSEVIESYSAFNELNVITIDASHQFYSALKGITDPEAKRKIIGSVFFKVFEEQKEMFSNAKFLAQGTIYPDVIESKSVVGNSATIKSHHNVGGMPIQDTFVLLEPLRELFKDEVRQVGRELGLPEHLIMRHPFPGPGLGVRILGEVTENQVRILQKADAILMEELKKESFYNQVSQAFVVLLPIRSVGVMGDQRTYEQVACIRSVNTIDFMTAEVSHLPLSFLEKVSNRICNEVAGINRVVFDLTSKPPGTIEWE